jgi:uncharacterized OB-fold protein
MFKWFGLVNFVPYTKVDGFAGHLRDGRIMGSRCGGCSAVTFPPRSDCRECLDENFEFIEYSGRGKLHTYTRIDAVPTGFERRAPYIVGVVDLEEGGRALAWFGDTVQEEDIVIGMELQLVPRMSEEEEQIRVYYSLERPGTQWVKTPGSV